MSREKKRCQAHPLKYKSGVSPQLELWNAAYQDNARKSTFIPINYRNSETF